MVEEFKDFRGAFIYNVNAVLWFNYSNLVHGSFALVEYAVPNNVPKNVKFFGLYLKDRGDN